MDFVLKPIKIPKQSSRFEKNPKNKKDHCLEGMKMTFDEYQKGVMRTASSVCTATKDNMLLNGILGAAGEAGELSDLLKKHLFHGHPFDKEHLVKECGDVLFYLALIAESLDTTLEEVAIANNRKLWERYPDGFEVEKSLHRKEGDV